MPSLAVIIPAFNAARYLGAALEGAMAQTHAADEILVVDDGSTDETTDVARRYPVRLIRHGQNRGPGAARNTGIAAARSDYLAFLDADDYWSPEHCGLLSPLLDENREAVLACARCTFLGGDGATPALGLPDGEAVEAVWTLLRANPVVQSAALVRREAVIAAGGYDEGMRYAEDYDLWLRLSRRGRFIGRDQVTCTRRIHSNQLSHNAMARITLGAWHARIAAAERLRSEGTPEDRQEVDAVLLETWLTELDAAARTPDRAAMEAVGTVRHLVPGAERQAYRWIVRRHITWPAGRVMRSAADRFPRIGRLLRRLRGQGMP